MSLAPPNKITKDTKRIVEVQPGDTLWGIAQSLLGNGNRWHELQGYSGDPHLLPIGTRINLPPFQPPVAHAPLSLTGGTDSPSATMTSMMPPPSKSAPAPVPTPAPTPSPQLAVPPATHPVYDQPVSTPQFVAGTPEWVKADITEASQKYQIPTMMLSALLKQESGFNPNARSPVGALGIAQFMPGTAQGMGVNPLDPHSAIMGSAQYLRQGWDRFGKPELALAAYNAGGGAVQKYGGIPPYKETQNYVKNIMAMAGQPHQSANGPYLDTMTAMKTNSAKQASQPLATSPFPRSNQPPTPTPTPPQQPGWADLTTTASRPLPRWQMPGTPASPDLGGTVA